MLLRFAVCICGGGMECYCRHEQAFPAMLVANAISELTAAIGGFHDLSSGIESDQFVIE